MVVKPLSTGWAMRRLPQVLLLLVAFIVFAGVGPTGTAAQRASQDPAGGLWVGARLGGHVPLRHLGRTDILASSGYGAFERADRGGTLGFDALLHVSPRWALRATLDRAGGASVAGEWKCVPFVACPSVLLPLDGELSHWTGVLAASFRAEIESIPDPRFWFGLGFRRNALEWGPPAADITLPAVSFHETTVAYRLGVGIEQPLGRARAFGEVETTASRFGGGLYQSIEGGIEADRRLAVDLTLTAGLRVRLR